LIGLVAREAVIACSHLDIFKYFVMWHILWEVGTAPFKYLDEFCLYMTEAGLSISFPSHFDNLAHVVLGR